LMMRMKVKEEEVRGPREGDGRRRDEMRKGKKEGGKARGKPFDTLRGATPWLASRCAPITTGMPLGQRVLGSQLIRGDVGERSGACGGCSASSSAFAAAAGAEAKVEETDLRATTLGTSCSSASPGTTAPLGAWTAAAFRISEE